MNKKTKAIIARFEKRVRKDLLSPEGLKAIDKALEQCEQETERIRQVTEVDWRKLDEPITI